MNLAHDSLIVRLLGRILLPAVQLYGLYVLFFGQYGPGGGFVGGVIVGASLLLSMLVFGPPKPGTPLHRFLTFGDGVGLLVFAMIGGLALCWGGEFLHYGAIPLPGLDAPLRRSLGIVGTQVGVALDVAATAVSVFVSLAPFKEEVSPDA